MLTLVLLKLECLWPKRQTVSIRCSLMCGSVGYNAWYHANDKCMLICFPRIWSKFCTFCTHANTNTTCQHCELLQQHVATRVTKNPQNEPWWTRKLTDRYTSIIICIQTYICLNNIELMEWIYLATHNTNICKLPEVDKNKKTLLNNRIHRNYPMPLMNPRPLEGQVP